MLNELKIEPLGRLNFHHSGFLDAFKTTEKGGLQGIVMNYSNKLK